MAKLMDLHNNKMGRNLFLELKDEPKNEVIKALILKLNDAVKINEETKTEQINNLVFLKD